MVLNVNGEMGNNVNSLPKGRRKSLKSFLKKSNKSNLSHTFTLPYVEEEIELLNVNLASEEELMTLPGINREIAKNIVDHRKIIGRYRKVEDVALVRGIGAEKLDLIKPEICVSTRRNHSVVSSRAPSYDSLKSSDSRSVNRSIRVLINVNKASVFELQSVPGITQEIAAAIVTRRNKKGLFSKVDDLIKVKSISRMRLDNIARYLTVEEDVGDETISEQSTFRPSILTNGCIPNNERNNYNNRNSIRCQVPNGFLAPSSVIDIFELLSTYSPRPIINNLFKFKRNGQSAMRIASWNLHKFTRDKSSNLGVKEVICMILLENGISLLAVQDIKDVIGLKNICDELNKPTLKRVENWNGNSRCWNFCMLDVANTSLGFIYDSGCEINIELISLMEGPEDTQNHCDTLIGHFFIDNINIQIVNMSLKEEGNVKFLSEKLANLISEEENVLICIDFSNYLEFDEEMLNLGGLKSIFSSSTKTNFSILKTINNDQHYTTTSHISNMLINSELRKHLTGFNNVVSKKGLTHLAIPNGWTWGGPVSIYCPIWVELFTILPEKKSF